MTPRSWYLAAVAVLAMIITAVTGLAVVSSGSDGSDDSAAGRSAAPSSRSGATPRPAASSTMPMTTAAPTTSSAPTPTAAPTVLPSPTPGDSSSTAPITAGHVMSSPPPTLPADSLAIPVLGVTAPIDMCLIVDGGLQPPADVRRTCYWAGGATVGAHSGTTVITGECDVCGSAGGALSRINQLRSGDTVYTSGGHARVVAWRVSNVIYRPKSEGILPDAFVGRQGPRRLYLVSAGGPYVGGAFLDNVYVLAVPASG